jgi:hypothetical protein
MSRNFAACLAFAMVVTLCPGVVNAQWAAQGDHIYNTNSGYVGIGTASPSYLLDVRGSVTTGNRTALGIRNLITDASGTSFFSYGSVAENDTTYSGSSVADVAGAILTTRWRGTGSTGSMGLKAISAVQMNAFNYNSGVTDWLVGGRFDIRNLGSGTVARMAGFRVSAPIVSGGTVTNWYGLYLDNPGSPATNTYSIYAAGGNAYFGADMSVAGNVIVAGNIAAKYQDVAEWVPASESLASGTVVSIDTARTNTVRASTTPYDDRVAGVISEMPGLLLGEEGEGKVMVATTGRVKVRVDATRAPIGVGDLLVTSGKSGTAMRSETLDIGGVQIHRPGTIIGKALEPLKTGEGEILVLLSLQ